MFNKDKLVFDPLFEDDTDNVGAYLRASDGTLLTHTDVSGKKALDVNVANTVHIRALDFSADRVDASGSNVSISGDVNVTQGTSPWIVSATDLGIRDLSAGTDSVSAVQSGSWEVSLDSATLAALEDITVSAADFDIRDLSYTQDSVAIKGSTGNQLAIEADGSINANVDVSVVNGSDKAEDEAHASGDIGTYVLAVRQDTLAASTSANGDYGSFKTNDKGALWVKHDGVMPIAPGGYTGWLVTQNTVDTSVELVVASDFTNRKKIIIQNVSNRTVYLGHSNSLTVGNGMRLAANGSVELEISAGVAIYAIANSAGADLRVAELAA